MTIPDLVARLLDADRAAHDADPLPPPRKASRFLALPPVMLTAEQMAAVDDTAALCDTPQGAKP
jgi:hypothetical protein